MLFELALKLGNEAGNFGSLRPERRNDMGIGHPYMVGALICCGGACYIIPRMRVEARSRLCILPHRAISFDRLYLVAFPLEKSQKAFASGQMGRSDGNERGASPQKG
jgi:hypothetical protein